MTMINYELKKAETLSAGVDNLYTIITLLRSPDGCPWDKTQTNKSTTQSLIDEAYEYLDGVINNDIASEREEIGDVLINVFMNLYIHDENKDFKPVDALNEVCEKLIRRHPHVFADKKVSSNDEALSLWNSVKENVEGKKVDSGYIFSHIPHSLPPLEESYEIQKKLAKVGFDWSDVSGIYDKINEELDEVKDAVEEGNKDDIELEIGDLLFSVVNLARFLKVRPNIAIHRTNEKVKSRFLKLFALAEERNIPLDKYHVDEMNMLWDEIKSNES